MSPLQPHLRTPSGLPRARGLGIAFDGVPGPFNAITDVPGLEVGYRTLIGERDGATVRTGVTIIHPRGRAHAHEAVEAGCCSFNGNGELTGLASIEEFGSFTMPIAITSTYSVGVAYTALIKWMDREFAGTLTEFGAPVVSETYDGLLHDIAGHHVTEDDVLAAIDDAHSGPLEEGSVGGGAGMVSFDLNAGSGTASRQVAHGAETYTVGAFVQANYGRRESLVIRGTPLGQAFPFDRAEHERAPDGGSIVIVIATDAPLLPGQCAALARRASLALGRTGAYGSVTSGDLFLAFSVGNPPAAGGGEDALARLDYVPWGSINPFYAATVDAVEEAILNAIVANEPATGPGGYPAPILSREAVDLILARQRQR